MAKLKKLKIVCDAACRIPNANIQGRSSNGKSACGIIFIDENDNIIQELSFYLGEMTVSQAEYNGLIKALDSAGEHCRKDIEIWMDSEFIVKQLNGDYAVSSENVKPLYDKVKTLEKRFTGKVDYFHHPRTTKFAKYVDKLANNELDKRASA